MGERVAQDVAARSECTICSANGAHNECGCRCTRPKEANVRVWAAGAASSTLSTAAPMRR